MITERLGAIAARGRGTLELAALGSGARQVKREGLTYLSNAKLRSLEASLRTVLDSNVPGDVVECGVALGGSGILLASEMGEGRAFHGYDVFGMIPAPGERDGEDAHQRYATIKSGASRGLRGGEYYGYVDDLQTKVETSFAKHGVPVTAGRVELHRGLFEDTLTPAGPVALAHIDSDWYDPVSLCLERIWPVLSTGGRVVLDDYRDYSGCARACHEFLSRHDDATIETGDPHLVISKRGAAARH